MIDLKCCYAMVIIEGGLTLVRIKFRFKDGK